MTVQITIIGTGQIGTSMGLALAEHRDLFLRVGHDKDFKVASRAKDMGAFDRVERNLPNSVSGAQIVVLALPLNQIQETFRYIVQDLQDEAVVMETAPIKSTVFSWASELLPAKCHYIGLTPVLNPVYLDSNERGVEAAHADLFKNGLVAILTPPGVPSEAIKLATDFTHLLGAGHIFIDPVELDSMMAATHILPQLMAAALLNTTVDQPGWMDARKLAGQPYADVTRAVTHSEDAQSLSSEAMAAKPHLARLINALVGKLYELSEQLSENEADQLFQEISRASLGRERWLKERSSANWNLAENEARVELPTSGQVFARLFTFGGGRKPKPPKQKDIK
ncbi:MAG TPA: prephenate dehydrogenase/arogenate dehydrogenase family protein [Anaerolineales bacterium]